ncbi:MAG: anti-sigma factor [Rhodanobacter sp.]
MNTPSTTPADDLRHAEYALGVLDAESRAAVTRAAGEDPAVAADIALWQQRLLPLAEDVQAVTPPDYVWTRIRDQLQLAPVQRQATATSLWDSLRLWRWLGIGASVVAAACLVVIASRPAFLTAPNAASASYMTASIRQDNGVVGWTATMDVKHAQMVVMAAAPAPMARNHAAELWLIPAGGKPMSLGMIAMDRPTAITLDKRLLARIDSRAALAVSIEPMGGSPTGAPTGPVVAKGAIGGA